MLPHGHRNLNCRNQSCKPCQDALVQELEVNKVTPEQRAEVQKFVKRFLKLNHPAAMVYK